VVSFAASDFNSQSYLQGTRSTSSETPLHERSADRFRLTSFRPELAHFRAAAGEVANERGRPSD
jgi:hypothetical protein